jgi:hypothetical protein
MSDSQGVIQVVIPPTLRGPLEEWLHRRNLELVRLPYQELGLKAEDDLPTYIIGFA